MKFIANYNSPSPSPLFPSKPMIKVHELGVKTWLPSQDKDSASNRRFMIGEDLPRNAKWEFRIAGGNDLGHFQLSQLNDSMAQLELVGPANAQVRSNYLNESWKICW